MAFLPLDGPAIQGQANVTTTTVFRVRAGASELEERNVVTIQGINGVLWVYFGDGTNTPTANDVRTKGFRQPKNAIGTYEAGARQPIFVLADIVTVDVRFAERS